jgi:ATP-dependent Clp protease ATP-binding subunit ClpA
VILIMTTNAGAADLAKSAYGFTRTKREGDDVEAINRMFAPEFRNRLDATITFAHLSQEVISKVVEKFVMQLEAQLADRNVTIELSEDSSKWLIEHGYDEQMGARPMARVIQEYIKKPLADEVLFGKLKTGGHVRSCWSRTRSRREQARLRVPKGRSRRSREDPDPTGAEAPAGAHTPQQAAGPQGDGGPSHARLGAEGAAGQGLTGIFEGKVIRRPGARLAFVLLARSQHAALRMHTAHTRRGD